MSAYHKYISVWLLGIIFVLLFPLCSVLYAQNKEYSLIEEDELFWSRLLSDPAISNRNELYASYVAYTERFYDLAVETFNNCIRRNISNETIKSISYYYIGKIFYILGKYNDAIVKFKSASELNLGKYSYIKSAIMLNMAIAYHKLNNSAEFKAVLDEVIKFPTDVKYKEIAVSMLPDKDQMTLKKSAEDKIDKNKTEKIEIKEVRKYHKYMTLGINAGEMFILGNWGDIYNNTEFINPFFSYAFNEFAAVSLNVDYLSTEVKLKTDTYYSSLILWGATAGINFSLKFTEIYSISFSIGAGAARTVVTTPGINVIGDRKDDVSKTHDPYMNTGLSFNAGINNIEFRIGVSSKTVYYYDFKKWKYENNDMDLIGVFFGVSIKT